MNQSQTTTSKLAAKVRIVCSGACGKGCCDCLPKELLNRKD